MFLDQKWLNPNWATQKFPFLLLLYTQKPSRLGMFTKDFAEKMMSKMINDPGLGDN